nr:acetyl-coenzyme A synthetase 2-like, mitochondrial [Meriones unguiculatus]
MAARSLGSGVGRLLRGLHGRSGQSGWSPSLSCSTATRLLGSVPAAAQPGSYPALSAQAAQEPAAFWGPLARDTLVWDTPYHTVWDCDFRTGKIGWFLGGQLNVSELCDPEAELQQTDLQESRFSNAWLIFVLCQCLQTPEVTM